MGTNVEIKARLADVERARRAAESLSGGPPQVFSQVDTFYRIPAGRLKLRRQTGAPAELIYYDRPDTPGPKRSDYAIHTTGAPDELDRVLQAALGRRAVVRKVRRLYLAGDTRIHLDEVAGLGWFLELEVVLGPGQPVDAGRERAEQLLGHLGVQPADLVSAAYVDLLEQGSAPGDQAL